MLLTIARAAHCIVQGATVAGVHGVETPEERQDHAVRMSTTNLLPSICISVRIHRQYEPHDVNVRQTSHPGMKQLNQSMLVKMN